MTLLDPIAPAAVRAIDWSRMARPQADGYDTRVVLDLARHGTSPLRAEPWRRRGAEGAPTLFGGRVAVRHRTEPGGLQGPRYAPAPLDHPNLAGAEAALAAWPEAAAQVADLIDTLQPWTDTSIPPDQARAVPGSSSHSVEAEFGVIMATVDHPLGLAQALVHEMAHHKLRAMGVSLLSADRLIANDPAELFASPIIVDRKRPMTAVVHAQYSFIHVTALDVALYDHPGRTQAETPQILFLLARNVPRMDAGYAEIERHLKTDAEGAVFMEAFMSWSRTVLKRGHEILDANGYGMPPI